MDTIKINIWNDDDKESCSWEREINKNLTVGEIRTIIYEECVKDKEGY